MNTPLESVLRFVTTYPNIVFGGAFVLVCIMAAYRFHAEQRKQTRQLAEIVDLLRFRRQRDGF